MIRFLAGLSIFAAACGAPSIEEVREQTGENLAALAQDTYDAVESSTNSSSAITRLYDALNITMNDLGKMPLTRPSIPARTDYQSTFDTYKQYLMDRVFLKDNIEGSGVGSVTFLVNGERFCTDPKATNTSQAAIDSCAKSIDQLELRIVVSGNPSSKLALDIVLGPKQRKVATVILEKDTAIEVQVFTGEYMALIQDFAAASSMPSTIAPYSGFRVEGDFSYRLEKLGPKDVRMTYSVLRDVRYEYTGTDGVTRGYRMAARQPMYQVRFNGPAGTHEAKMDVGTVSYNGLWGDYYSVADGGMPDKTPFEATVQGVTFEATTAASPAIAKGSFSFGNAPSTFTYGGNEVMRFSMPSPVTFTLDDDTDGRLRLDTSEIDATAKFHFSLLPNLGNVDPAFADETYRVRFNGGAQAVKLAAVDTELGVKVISGTFGVEAQNAARSVTAPVGMCLVTPKMPPQNEVPLLKVLAAVPCN